MGIINYRGQSVPFSDAPLLATAAKLTMTYQQYANVAALTAAKTWAAGQIFVVNGGFDTTDGALAAATLAAIGSRPYAVNTPYDAYIVLAGAATVSYYTGAAFASEVTPQLEAIDVALNAGVDAFVQVYTFKQLVAAVAAAVPNQVIKLASGAYNFTDTLLVTQPIALVCDALASFTNYNALAKPLVSINLAKQVSAPSPVSFTNVTFLHQTSGQDNIDVNNTTIAQTLKINFQDCNSQILAGAGYGLKIAQSDATKAINIYMRGRKAEIVNNIYTACANAANLLDISDMRVLPSGSATYAIVTAGSAQGTVSLKQCEVKATKASNTASGTAQSFSSFYGWSDNGAGTLAKIAAGDFVNPAGGIVIIP